MLTHPTLEKLDQLRFSGMAGALREQLERGDSDRLDFMERLGLLVDREAASRYNARIKTRLRRARLRQQACIEDIDYRRGRGLDRRFILHLATCDWIRQKQNVVVTGPTGVGKSYLACALAHKACLEGFTVRYFRLPRLLEDLTISRGDGSYLKLLQQLARFQVLVLDDWGLMPLTTPQQQDLLELLDDRHQVRSTIATSQMPVKHWHEAMDNPTLADAILDRLVHNAHRIELTGGSMRKHLYTVSSVQQETGAAS